MTTGISLSLLMFFSLSINVIFFRNECCMHVNSGGQIRTFQVISGHTLIHSAHGCSTTVISFPLWRLCPNIHSWLVCVYLCVSVCARMCILFMHKYYCAYFSYVGAVFSSGLYVYSEMIYVYFVQYKSSRACVCCLAALGLSWISQPFIVLDLRFGGWGWCVYV